MVSPTATQRLRLSIAGTVQGVGFRPFVHRLANSLQVIGFVRNEGNGVTIEVQGGAAALSHFIERLHAEAPALSRIESCTIEELRITDDSAFVVRESGASGGSVAIPPDLATCDACLRELFDPGDRRYRYPFITCTHCGPRYSIVWELPYDRARTTMAAFAMCVLCEQEYHDARNRRFHAETNACAACGPAVGLFDADGTETDSDSPVDPIARAARLLGEGAIVAVKGIGGYHLACRADDAACVARLRERKQRDVKPLALMASDLRHANELVELNADEVRLLESVAHPILLARKRAHAPIADNIAPGRAEFGVMLPYSPLHHLLLHDAGVTLVLTSGNRSDEPISYGDADARDRLSEIADFFLVHNRPIHARCDDSVMRIATVAGVRQPLMLRRSRGFVPSSIPLPATAPEPMLACGAELKSTVTVAYGRKALVGPHLGDLETFETLQAFNASIAHLGTLSGVRPTAIVCDQHPDYLSTRYARKRAEHAVLHVQHHHAHLAACLAEYGYTGPALGLILDGTGYGTDGTIWGGELLVGDLAECERIGHLLPVRLPGSAAAVREPWRMACAWLAAAGVSEQPETIRAHVSAERWAAVQQLLTVGHVSPVTTSAGRLFDAIAAICGVRCFNTYEAQAAIELEAIAQRNLDETYSMPVYVQAEQTPRAPDSAHEAVQASLRPGSAATLILDARPLVLAVLHDVIAGRDCSAIAACAHNGVANAAITSLRMASERTGIHTAVLSGGVFQNKLLLERLSGELATEGWRVLVPRVLPPNDGGISFGQAAVAAARSHRTPTVLEGPDVPGDTRTDPGHGGP